MIRVAALEEAGSDFSIAKGRTCALLAAAGCAGHLNMSLSPNVGVYSNRLIALLDSVQNKLPEDEVAMLKAQLLTACDQGHPNAAFSLNQSSAIMTATPGSPGSRF